MNDAAESDRGGTLDDREREFLQAFFLQLHEATIPYVWMRFYEEYPESARP